MKDFTYTGMTSASQNKVSIREKAKDEKEKNQRELEPFAPAIFEIIKSEKEGLGLILAGLIDTAQSPRETQAHIEAVKLHRDFLLRFDIRVKNILRTRKKSVVQGESFAEIMEGAKDVKPSNS